MCSTCEDEDSKVELLKEAKADRSKVTNELLDWLIEYIESAQAYRLERID